MAEFLFFGDWFYLFLNAASIPFCTVFAAIFLYMLLFGIIVYKKNPEKRRIFLIISFIALAFLIAKLFTVYYYLSDLKFVPVYTILIAVFSAIAGVILIKKSFKFIFLAEILFLLSFFQILSFGCYMAGVDTFHAPMNFSMLKTAKKFAIAPADKKAILLTMAAYQADDGLLNAADELVKLDRNLAQSILNLSGLSLFEYYAQKNRTLDAINAGLKNHRFYLAAAENENSPELKKEYYTLAYKNMPKHILTPYGKKFLSYGYSSDDIGDYLHILKSTGRTLEAKHLYETRRNILLEELKDPRKYAGYTNIKERKKGISRKLECESIKYNNYATSKNAKCCISGTVIVF